jgi:hypothetical protein
LKKKATEIINPKTDKIVQNNLRIKLSMIFEKFDKNKNGQITAETVDLESVPLDIVIIFRPLLMEIEAYNEKLDRDEFIESSLALLQVSF